MLLSQTDVMHQVLLSRTGVRHQMLLPWTGVRLHQTGAWYALPPKGCGFKRAKPALCLWCACYLLAQHSALHRWRLPSPCTTFCIASVAPAISLPNILLCIRGAWQPPHRTLHQRLLLLALQGTLAMALTPVHLTPTNSACQPLPLSLPAERQWLGLEGWQ